MTSLRLGYALIALAGCVDAVGFLRLGGLFVSFMSGNSTKAAIALIHGHPEKSLQIVCVVALFVLGSFAGELPAQRLPRRGQHVVLFTVAGLLAVAAFWKGSGIVPAVPAILAMGVQNAALRKIGSVTAALTYVTGALVHFGQELADAAGGKPSRWRTHGFMWLSMVAGAGAGAVLFDRFHARAFLACAIFALLCAFITMIPQRRKRSRGSRRRIPVA